MSSTPKPFQKEGADVIPLDKRRAQPATPRRREGTIEYDTRTGQTRDFDAPTSRHEVVVGARGDESTDRMTLPDGPPTVEQEIPIELTDLAPPNPIDALPTMTFVAGALIRDKSLDRGPTYYEILSGVARMGDRDLEEGDFIGLIQFAEVSAKTPLRVRTYDLPKIAATNNTTLLLSAQGRLFAASAKLANATTREADKMRGRVEEYEAMLRGRLDELKEKVLRPIRLQLGDRARENLDLHERIGGLTRRLADKDAELAALKPWVEETFERVPHLLEEITLLENRVERMRIDREADMASVELTLQNLSELVDQGVIDASRVELTLLISEIDPALSAMSVCDNMALAQMAVHALGALHRMQMRVKKLPGKPGAPAT